MHAMLSLRFISGESLEYILRSRARAIQHSTAVGYISDVISWEGYNDAALWVRLKNEALVVATPICMPYRNKHCPLGYSATHDHGVWRFAFS